MGVNRLPETVTRQPRGCDLNPGPSAPESSTLTARLPSHPKTSHYRPHNYYKLSLYHCRTEVSERLQLDKRRQDSKEHDERARTADVTSTVNAGRPHGNDSTCKLCPIHSADADKTKLSSFVTSEV